MFAKGFSAGTVVRMLGLLLFAALLAWGLSALQQEQMAHADPLAPTKSLKVDKEGAGSGTVTSDPTGIDCGGTCTWDFAEDDVVTLSAAPDGDSVLAGWDGGGCAGYGDCVVTMDTDKVVTATFEVGITVDTTDDEYDTVPGQCSLREAVTAANTDTAFGGCPAGDGADLINLPAGTYTLTGASGEDGNASGDLDVWSEITVDGAGQTMTIIQAGTTDTNGVDRVFHVTNSSGDLTLEDAMVRHGKEGGYGGGAFIDEGTLTLEHSTLSDNEAGYGGGAVYMDQGALEVITSTISNNDAGRFGGGVENQGGTVSVTGSVLDGNSAQWSGGALYLYGAATVKRSTISGNTTPSDGGGILSEYPLTIRNSTLSGNSAGYYGGAMEVRGTTVLENTTVSGNSAKYGGGIDLGSSASNASLVHCTVTQNSAPSGYGGAVRRTAGTVDLKNSIVAGNSATYGGQDCDGAVASQGYNLVGSGGGCPSGGTGDETTTDAKLGPLQGNGGPATASGGATNTHSLLAGSPGQDMIPGATSGCGTDYTADQRGVARPQNYACDAGAYETGITVDTTDDEYGTVPAQCSLREAVTAANTDAAFGGCPMGSGADTIYLPAGTYTLTGAAGEDGNASGDLDVWSEILIDGDGQATTVIQAGTTDSNGVDRVFHVINSSGDLTLEGVTTRYGKVSGDGGGAYIVEGTLTLEYSTLSDNEAGSSGGAVYMDQGALEVITSTISGNQANHHGGAVENQGGAIGVTGSALDGNSAMWGGAVYNKGTMTVAHSIFSGNTSTADGGAILTFSTLTILRSTLSGNQADQDGGAVLGNTGSATLINTTVSGNSAAEGGGVHSDQPTATINLVHCTVTDNTASGWGGGVKVYLGALNLKNSIVAGNSAPFSSRADCHGAATSQGYNLVGSGTGCPSGGAGDQTTADAKLGPLQDNGGPATASGGATHTHAVLLGSPAADIIPGGSSGCGTDYTVDQRGAGRPQNFACEAGAYETGITVDTIDDEYGTVPAQCSLREAITAANTDAAFGGCPMGSGADVIYVPAGTYTLTGASGEDGNASGDLDVWSEILIEGDGQATTIVQAGTTDSNGVDRVFHVTDASGDLTLDGVGVRYGNVSGHGGGVYAESGALRLEHSSLSDCSASSAGGGVASSGGTLAVISSTISGNSATHGGGIYAGGSSLEIDNAILSENEGHYGGGLYNYTAATVAKSILWDNVATWSGGGIQNVGTISLEDSTLLDNSSATDGGGLWDGGVVAVANSTFSGNSSGQYGGGAYSQGNATLTNCTLSGNWASRGGGAAVSQSSGTATLAHCTVTGNSGSGGGIYVDLGGTVNAKNSIVAGNGSGIFGDCNGALASQGYNLVGSGTGCPSGGTGDQTTTDAKLGPLQGNGGATDTHAVLLGSPAVNMIPSGTNGCGGDYVADQRGATRPGDSGCDAGAYESSFLVWDGGGADNNTSTAGNWSGDRVPQAGDVLVFDGTSSKDATVDSDLTSQGWSIDSAYGGTISQGAFNLVLNGGWAQEGGTFSGGSGAIDLNGNLDLGGGSFSATSGEMAVSGDWDHSGGTFSHNSGTVSLDGDGAQTITGINTFYDLTVGNSSDTEAVDASASTLVVANQLLVEDGTFLTASDFHHVQIVYGGELELSGDVTVSGDWDNEGALTHNDHTVEFDGSGAQDLNGSSTFYDLTVNNSSASDDVDADGTTLVVENLLHVQDGTFQSASDFHDVQIDSDSHLWLSGDVAVSGDWSNDGCLAHFGRAVTFNGDGAQTISGSTSFGSLIVANTSGTEKVDATGSTLGVEGMLYVLLGTFVSASDLDEVRIGAGGTLELSGDVTVSGDWENEGTFTHNDHGVTFDGGITQEFEGTSEFGNVTVDSGTTVRLATGSEWGFSGAFDLNGAFDAATNRPNTVRMASGADQTLEDGATDLHHLIVETGARLDAPSSLEVAGDLTVDGVYAHKGGAVSFDGSGVQVFSGAATFHDVTVGSGSSLRLAQDASFRYRGDLVLGGGFDPTTNSGTSVTAGSAYTRTLPAASFHDLTVSDSLVGYWKLDDGAGTTAADSSGYGHHGTFVNGPGWDTAVKPGAIDFQNHSSLLFEAQFSDHVLASDTPVIDDAEQLTLAAWVMMLDAPDRVMRFVTIQNEKASLRYNGPSGPGQLQYFIKTSDGFHNVRQNNALSTSIWYHIAGTYDGTHMRLYLNGVQQGVDVPVTGSLVTGRGVVLGNWGIESFDGRLDDVRIYDRALSDDEIADLAAGGHPDTSFATTVLDAPLDVGGDLALNSGTLSQPPVELYWKLDESAGKTATDESGNGYDGRLFGATSRSSDTPSLQFANPHAVSFKRSTPGTVVVTGTTQVDDLQELSLAVWVKVSEAPTVPQDHSYMRFLTLSNEKAVLRYHDNDGYGYVQFLMTINGLDGWINVVHTWDTSAWVHVTGTYDGNRMRLYVDGVEGGVVTYSGLVETGDGVYLSHSGGEALAGILDDARVYGRALTADEVKLLAAGYDVRSHDISVEGDFVRNGGIYEQGNSKISFDGNATQYLDTDEIEFEDMEVVAWADLDLGTHTVIDVEGELSNKGIMHKTAYVGSGGVGFFDTGGYGGVILDSDPGPALGDTTVTIKGNRRCTVVAGETVRRCFDIEPSNTTGLDAAMTLYFSNEDLAGHNCHTLDVYHWDGSSWSSALTLDPIWYVDGRACAGEVSEPYSVRVHHVNDFSPVVTGSDGTPDGDPTVVRLAGFSATAEVGGVLLRWETVSEMNLQGFHLYRQAGEGDVVRVTGELIEVAIPGNPVGSVYEYLDSGVTPGETYRYWLDDVDISGEPTRHGPLEVLVGGGYRLWLPVVRR